MSGASAFLCAGSVTHQRLRPLRHRLRYRMFCMLVELDELPRLDARLRLFSLNRFNLFSLHERDHGAPPGQSLRDHIDAQLAAAGIRTGGGTIQLLAMPRILGYAFNPLSVYFCRDAAGAWVALIYEVRNTFGERHRYLVEVPPGQAHARELRHTCDKQFHVSPFMGMHMRYAFTLAPPQPVREGLRIGIDVADAQGPVLVARLDMPTRQVLDDRSLLRSFLSHPLLGLKVIAGIHWEALRLLVKGAPLRRHPGPAEQPVTIVRTHHAP